MSSLVLVLSTLCHHLLIVSSCVHVLLVLSSLVLVLSTLCHHLLIVSSCVQVLLVMSSAECPLQVTRFLVLPVFVGMDFPPLFSSPLQLFALICYYEHCPRAAAILRSQKWILVIWL